MRTRVAELREPANSARMTSKSGSKAPSGTLAETTVTLTHPEKLLWPDVGVSKQGLLDHYAKAWPRMERFVVDRPLSLVRAPAGIGGPQFFQKHASSGMHAAIQRMNDPDDGEEILFIRDFDGLAALVQNGVVEIHVWGSTVNAIETPDQVIFDLDPDEGLGVEEVRAATLDIKAKLDNLDLPSFLKTSGGKGFHIVAPLTPKADWATVKAFAHDFAHALEQGAPDRYTATVAKKARTGRIFVDYLRNGRGSTTVAPWSTRAKPTATVSVPITFDMLQDGAGPADFRIGNSTLEQALGADDPWQDFFKVGRPLGG